MPISRPIRVLCRHDRLVILRDRHLDGAEVVRLEGSTDDAVDRFVSAVWEHMEDWGIAGNGLYWRPILILEPGPNGRRRAADLKRLLQGSGLDVREEQR